MWSFFGAALDWLKSKPSILFGIFAFSIVVTALPKSWRTHLGYDELIKPYRGLINLVALASIVLLLVMFIGWLISSAKPPITKKWKQWRLNRKAPILLKALSGQEKSYVAKFVQADRSTLPFSITDGVINGLEGKGIVSRGSEFPIHLDRFDFNLHSWAQRTLQKYPELKEDILKHYEPERGGNCTTLTTTSLPPRIHD